MACIDGIDSTSTNMPVETAVPHIAAAWVSRIQRIGQNVASQNQAMAPGQATACQMRFASGTVYSGNSNAGEGHAEVHCLVQAHNAGENLNTGQFVQLTNPTCLICATVLFAVGITTVPALAHQPKEYANYVVPDFLFNNEQQHGTCHRLLGTNAWTAWTGHISQAARAKPVNRRTLVVQMTQKLSRL